MDAGPQALSSTGGEQDEDSFVQVLQLRPKKPQSVTDRGHRTTGQPSGSKATSTPSAKATSPPMSKAAQKQPARRSLQPTADDEDEERARDTDERRDSAVEGSAGDRQAETSACHVSCLC